MVSYFYSFILLSALMRLASTSAGILYKSLDSWHHWRAHIGIKGSDWRPCILILDSILVHVTWNVNEFVSISELMQSRKNKINSKDITERFLFTLFDSSMMTQIVERVYIKVSFLITSDWCSPIIITNFFLHVILKNHMHKFYSLSLKWIGSTVCNIFFITFYNMARAVYTIWIHLPFFQCLILGVRNNIWDQTFCVIELSLQLESRGEARKTEAL